MPQVWCCRQFVFPQPTASKTLRRQAEIIRSWSLFTGRALTHRLTLFLFAVLITASVAHANWYVDTSNYRRDPILTVTGGVLPHQLHNLYPGVQVTGGVSDRAKGKIDGSNSDRRDPERRIPE